MKFLTKKLVSTLGWQFLFVLPVISLVIFWFILKWIWPDIKFWYYISLLLSLCVLVVFTNWIESILRRRRHRAFIGKLDKVSKGFAESYHLSLSTNERLGVINFSFEHPSEGQCQIGLQKYDKGKPMLVAQIQWPFNRKHIFDGVSQKGERQELVNLEEKYISAILIETFENIITWQKPPQNKENEILNNIDLEKLPGPDRSALVYYRDEVVWSPNHKYFALAYSINEATMGNEIGFISWGTVENGKATIIRNPTLFSISGNHHPWCKWISDKVFICKAKRYDGEASYAPLVAIDVCQGFKVIPETNRWDAWFDDIEKIEGEFQSFDEFELIKEIEKT